MFSKKHWKLDFENNPAAQRMYTIARNYLFVNIGILTIMLLMLIPNILYLYSKSTNAPALIHSISGILGATIFGVFALIVILGFIRTLKKIVMEDTTP